MELGNSFSSIFKLACLTVFLATSFISQAQAGSGKNQAWGKGGKKPQINTAPTINGVPVVTVLEGVLYVFQPDASDPDGDSLIFSIRNRPSWAGFDSRTGRLSGTPGGGDVGSYGNIEISVSDGTVTASLPEFHLAVESPAPQSGSVSLNWDAPTVRSDGTPLSISELAGYTVQYGSIQGEYTNTIGIDDPYATSLAVTDMPPGTYYFVLTARDTRGRESGYSGMLSQQVQ